MFSQRQETPIVDMVRQNNAIRLREIQQQIMEDNTLFEGINSVSLSSTDRVLQRYRIRMKQVYWDHLNETVPSAAMGFSTAMLLLGHTTTNF